MAAHATPAAVFHQIDASAPTLLFDEADASFGAGELIAVLNTGHQRDAAFVLRAGFTEGARRFATWAPAAYAALQQVPDTLASRSIIISLRRKSVDQSCKALDDKAIQRLQKSKKKVEIWCSKNRKRLANSASQMPEWLQNRAADNWYPLLAIADAAGGQWPALALQAARALVKKEQPAIGTQLLSDIRDILEAGVVRIFSSDLTAKLGALEDRPWANFEGRGPMMPSSVAKVLAPYGIAPKNIRDGQKVLRGYRAKQFEDAFARYLKSKSA